MLAAYKDSKNYQSTPGFFKLETPKLTKPVKFYKNFQSRKINPLSSTGARINCEPMGAIPKSLTSTISLKG